MKEVVIFFKFMLILFLLNLFTWGKLVRLCTFSDGSIK